MVKKLIIVCCAVIVISFVAYIGYRGVRMHRRADAMWEQCESDLRARDQPVTFADIEKLRPTIAPEYNGALMIENMSDELDKLNEDVTKGILFFDSDVKIDLFTEFDSIDLKPIGEFLAQHAQIFEKLEVLKGSRGGRTSLSYEGGLNHFMDSFMPSAGSIRYAAKLLLLQSLVAIRDGELDRAIHSTQLIAQIANTMDNEPNLIHRLVQMANDELFIVALEIILRYSNLDDKQAKMFQQLINNRLKQKSLKFSFQLERVFFFMICNGLISGEIPWSFFSDLDEPLKMSEIQIRENQIEGAEILGELVRAADKPSSILTVARNIDQQLDNLSDDPDRYQLIRLYIPSLSRAVELHNRLIARLRCAMVALAADRYYQQKEKFPDDLQQLVPDYLDSIPVDPFDDKALRSKKTDYGYVVYSIGENLVDDGGDVARTQKGGFGPDAGFRLSKDRSLPDAP